MHNYERNKQKFLEYHSNNPRIYQLLKKYALEAKQAGVDRISIALLVERIRWQVQVTTKSNDGFKISNTHRAFYARLLMEDVPALKGMFEICDQRGVPTDDPVDLFSF